MTAPEGPPPDTNVRCVPCATGCGDGAPRWRPSISPPLASGSRPDLSAFGTRADVVIGRDQVEREQWLPTWPAIEDFGFLVDDAQVVLSADGLMAVDRDRVDVDRHRRGRHPLPDGRVGPRSSCAALIERAQWIGVHTHFSLARGVPQTTHGTRDATQ